MEEIKVNAPAKINLGLHVISKRDDGYHNIETIFYPIDLCDVLSFKKADKFKFTTNSDELKSSPDNLIIKAKQLLETESNRDIKVNIHLEKNIPIGAGLGGGSSDAASVLKTLNKIFNLNVDVDKIKILGFRLGSDVPFFLNPRQSYASSRGESLEERKLKINYPILIVNPGIHVSTRWAYENVIHKTSEFNLKDLTQEHLSAPEYLSKIIKNDFEEVVIKKYPEIKNLKDELNSSGALFTLMTGSGSTLFSLFKDNLTAEKIKERFEKKYFVYLQCI